MLAVAESVDCNADSALSNFEVPGKPALMATTTQCLMDGQTTCMPCIRLMSNTHRRRDETVELRRVGGFVASAV